MALHKEFPRSPYEVLTPDLRWFPAAEELRSTAYEKLLPPLVAKIREEVKAWRDARLRRRVGHVARAAALVVRDRAPDRAGRRHADASSATTSPSARRSRPSIWLYDVRGARDKFDLLRFDASGAVSSNMFDEDWPRYVLKMATGAGKTKVLSLLIAWSFFHKLYEADSTLSRNFLLIAPNIIVLDRLRADFDGLRIFFNDPVLPDNGHAGQQLARRLPDHAAHPGRRARRPADRQHLPDEHPPRVSSATCPSRRSTTTTCATTSSRPFGPKPVGKTTDSKTDLGEIVREVDELAVFNDEAHHIHDNRAWPGSSASRTSITGCCRRTCGWRCRWT